MCLAQFSDEVINILNIGMIFLPRSFILAWKQVCFTQIPTQTIFLFAKYFHFSIIRKDNFPESALLTIGYQSKGVEIGFLTVFFAF